MNNKLILDTLYQIISAIYYFHNENLAHCDIKPQNILRVGNNVKLCDFGSVVYCLDAAFEDSDAGTSFFKPPESKLEIKWDRKAGDIWAVGITMLCVLFQTFPMD
mmetsp:Transcript_115933/g.249112  ORF Transcript_115933/g.249112 Transcript_115933/m.249112 type:complete len:105 (-) Transcript_115933:447-761(-)